MLLLPDPVLRLLQSSYSMISSSSDILVVVIAHKMITVMVVFTVTLVIVINSSSETVTAGVVVESPCPVGDVFTVTLREIDWSVTGFPFDHS